MNKRIDKSSFFLPLFILSGVFLLFIGLAGGLARIGMRVPSSFYAVAGRHGPIMVDGFLGTVITLERAVSFDERRYMVVPFITVLGGIALLGNYIIISQSLWLMSGVGLLWMYGVILRQQPALHTIVMGTGALLWASSHILWMLRLPFGYVASYWIGFLVLTVFGERIELSRIHISGNRAWKAARLTSALFLSGLFILLINFKAGMILTALGLLALSIWLILHDISRRTIHMAGLPRFISICLLTGYIWMIIGSGFMILYSFDPFHLVYDAMLHSIFLGFIFSMIFGHAPIILSSLSGIEIRFSPGFYIYLILLHLSLVLRVVSDIMQWPVCRVYGGLFGVVAILIFIGYMVSRVIMHLAMNRKKMIEG